jgi:alcohol dehydrogenase (NADP+)
VRSGQEFLKKRKSFFMPAHLTVKAAGIIFTVLINGIAKTNKTNHMQTTTSDTERGLYARAGDKIVVKGYGASGSFFGGETLKPMDIERVRPAADEVLIEVLYCGVCHSDIHQVANDWKNTIYPCVPGHEIIGRVAEAGTEVTKFKPGDVVGIGCMIDSCGECGECRDGEEQFCQGPHGPTMTYNGYLKPDENHFNTYGGFSTHIVAKEGFVLKIPASLELSAAAPILCAGITTYSPLIRWGVEQGDRVGVIGIGGLGHMAVMIAKAMGAHVTAITTKEEKRLEALQLGADEVIISDNEEEMKEAEISMDFILCTIPYEFDVNPYICLLRPRGSIVTVGLLGPYSKPTDNMEVAKLARTVGASIIGGITETQEVLDFCAEHHILPQVELIPIHQINEAFKRIKDEEVRFRYVINMQSLKDENE